MHHLGYLLFQPIAIALQRTAIHASFIISVCGYAQGVGLLDHIWLYLVFYEAPYYHSLIAAIPLGHSYNNAKNVSFIPFPHLLFW